MTDTSPSSDLTPVRAGFIPLVDCAVLVVAREKGFAAEHGIDLQLIKEVSWANIRDRINVGLFDVAHMLAGMPIAANLGIGHIRVPMIAPMALSAGGNAITLGEALYDEMVGDEVVANDPIAWGQALRQVVEARRRLGTDPVTFGMVFPFSCHNYQLRYWMAAAGIDPDRDVRLVVIPPPFMVKSLEAGQIDGFCVGEPWNSLAAAQGVGRVVLAGSQVWPAGPEKVLGLQETWAENNPEILKALLSALDQAAQWAQTLDHKGELAALLARPDYLDVPQDVVIQALAGDMKFHGADIRAGRAEALWLYAQMVRWGQTPLSRAGEEIAGATYRPDLMNSSDAETASSQPLTPLPLKDMAFDPSDVPGYIASEVIKF